MGYLLNYVNIIQRGEQLVDMYKKIDDLYDRRRKIELGGGPDRIAKQYDRGKQTARERINYLLDEDSFVELNPFITHRMNDIDSEAHGEGVVTGYGTINGRAVYLFAQDFTVFGGALGEMHAKKIANVMDLAAKNKVPFIGLNDSGGARIQEGVSSLDGYGQIFYRNSIYSGVIPQISVIMGPSAGGAVYSPALTDIIIMVEKTSKMFITGPKVIETVTGEKISAEDLGGAYIHNTISGNAHLSAASEDKALDMVKILLSYLPNSFEERAPKLDYQAEDGDEYRYDLLEIVPIDATRPYDIKKVIEEIVDHNSFFELHPLFAKNIVVGFARINGQSVGLVCNQPRFMAGGIDIDSSDKAARFIRLCD